MNLPIDEKIPKHPVLSLQSFTNEQGTEIPSILDAGDVRYLNRGSLAIAFALQHSGISHGDEVLIPAYHCLAMVEPVLWVGAIPTFYRIQENTEIDLADIGHRLTSSSRVLISPHYFGFLQDMKLIRVFCDEHHLILIEDCAHAFFGRRHGQPPGYYGDYAIGSAWKFFPVDEGACIVSSRGNLSGTATKSAGPFLEIKSLMNTLEYAVDYDRLGMLNAPIRSILKLKDKMWGRVIPSPVTPGVGEALELGVATGFDGKRVKQRNSIFSRLIIDATSKSRIVKYRRENYSRLLSALSSLPGCKPLFGVLPDEVVPHVFPLVMEHPEVVFPLLKAAGVPIIRFGEYLWDGMEQGLCPVSENYARRVFQFPCHQDLKPAELSWMIEQIGEAIK